MNRRPKSSPTTTALVLCLPAALLAHYHMLIPSRPAARPGEEVTCVLLFGHPFERELEAFARPRSLRVLAPGEAALRELPLPAGELESGRERSFRYTPERRGDHILAVEAGERIDAASGSILRDYLKVVLHVRAEDGWERALGQPIEVLPLTRPYGVRPGWVFQGIVNVDGKAREGVRIEVERYSETPPAGPLPEDPFITRTALTGPGGAFSMTLDEAGWWAICAWVPGGRAKAADGVERPVILRSTLWLWVGEPLLPGGG